MELKIAWTQFAENQLQDIFGYYNEKANKAVSNKLVTSILDRTIDLIKNPHLGQEEELLKHRPEGFRYLLEKNYKIIYWIDEDNAVINIANVFDCRQDELKILRTK